MTRLARLAELLPARGDRRTDNFLTHCRHDVRALLTHPGCPICGLLREATRTFFFWFLEERYCETGSLERLTGSYGFCPAHAGGLVRSLATYRIAVLHSLLFERILSRLCELLDLLKRGEPSARLLGHLKGLQPSRPCLACEELAEVAERPTRTLARCLVVPDLLDAYLAHPHGLCVVHFQAVVRLAPRMVLEPLCRRQSELLSGLQADLDRVLRPEDGGGGMKPAVSDDLTKALETVLEATVGTDPMTPAGGRRRAGARAQAPPGPDGDDGPPGAFDAIKALTDLLGQDACPVCVIRNRTLETYLAWLDREGRAQLAGQGTLDRPDVYCPPHTRAVFAAVHPPVAAHLAASRLARDLDQIQNGATRLAGHRASASRVSRPLRDRIEGLVPALRERRLLDEAREILTRPAHCLLCGHLAETGTRTLQLLFALLEDPGPRQAFARGWGLCVPHFLQGLALAPPLGVLAILLEGQIARLSVLQWEMDELIRKASWLVRYEPKGAEQTAWRRAAERLAGRLP